MRTIQILALGLLGSALPFHSAMADPDGERWVTYLALSFSLHPTFVILPFAMLFALTVAVTASTFKKYL